MSELKKAIKSLKRELEKLPSQDKPFAYDALGEVQEECDKMRVALEKVVKVIEMKKKYPGQMIVVCGGCDVDEEEALKLAREALKKETTDEN